ncbi:MAG TPA: DoxX family protein [Burkholderiales bacterium]|nr:DoxX family protein [Burkholderiales bacterium]
MDYQFQEEVGKLLLRLTVGILLLFHGIGKILNPGIVESIGSRLASDGWPASIAYGIYLGEVLAPLMIIFGVLARIGGLLVVINMVFAILLSHTAQLLTLSKSGGWALELQGLYLLCGIAIFFIGSGRMAVRPD